VQRLRGDLVIDEMQLKSKNTFTSAGLGPDVTTDNVLAWCALWGLSLLPVAHAVGTFSSTSASFRTSRSSENYTALPVWYSPLSPAKVRSILASADLTSAAGGKGDNLTSSVRLVERKIDGLMVFSFINRGAKGNANRRCATPGRPVSIGKR
jgi:CRISPR-associated protein Csb3